MEIEFANKKLEQLIDDEPAHWLPVSVISSARRKLQLIDAAKDERDLRNWKSLHYEKLSRDKTLSSIRLNKNWRMILFLSKRHNESKVKILSIEDYHS
uniref:Proteic killer suppression protein n=1 Tax=Candidatus Kentrum sp. TC TaxID=2126339 RepID=A0A450Y773_9GAMM|nr:MAG: proteic killer suppression protein [Candidatus Kentron sp. TC]